MPALLCGVGGQLGGGKGEDEPSASGVDRGQLQYVAKECADALRIAREDDRVDARDHGSASLTVRARSLYPRMPGSSGTSTACC